MIPSVPLHKLTRVAASAAVTAVPCRIFAVALIGGTSAASLKLTNDANGSGTSVFFMRAPFYEATGSAANTTFLDFSNLGGIEFSSKCYATIAGTGAEAYVWWD